MTIGLALIAKDEESTLPRLLRSIEGAFDQVVLCDTGSTDRTVRVFMEWGRRQGPPMKWRLIRHKWTDDFAEARNASFAALTTDWCCWADCDDEIVNARVLPALVAEAPQNVDALAAAYAYSEGIDMFVTRVARRGRATWINPVHEVLRPVGQTEAVPPDMCRWVHRKTDWSESDSRNARIAEAWLEREPNNRQALQHIAAELSSSGRYKEALPLYERAVAQDPPWDPQRVELHRDYALCLRRAGKLDAALGVAYEAVVEYPEWPSGYLTLAECFRDDGDPATAAALAGEALKRQEALPAATLGNAGRECAVLARAVLSWAFAVTGRGAEAERWALEATEIAAA